MPHGAGSKIVRFGHEKAPIPALPQLCGPHGGDSLPTADLGDTSSREWDQITPGLGCSGGFVYKYWGVRATINVYITGFSKIASRLRLRGDKTMQLSVKACELGEPVAVMQSGAIILGEPGLVGLVVEGPDGEAMALTMPADAAWEFAVLLSRESRKARRLAREAAK